MGQNLKRELQDGLRKEKLCLPMLLGAGVVGCVILGAVACLEPEGTYATIGSFIMLLVLLALTLFYETFALARDLEMALCFSVTRRDFLKSRIPVSYLRALYKLLLIWLWGAMELHLGESLMAGGMYADIRTGFPLWSLIIWALLLTGFQYFFTGLLMRKTVAAVAVLGVLYVALCRSLPMLLMDQRGSAAVFWQYLGTPQGILLAAAAGAALLAGGWRLLGRQRVTM